MAPGARARARQGGAASLPPPLLDGVSAPRRAQAGALLRRSSQPPASRCEEGPERQGSLALVGSPEFNTSSPRGGRRVRRRPAVPTSCPAEAEMLEQRPGRPFPRPPARGLLLRRGAWGWGRPAALPAPRDSARPARPASSVPAPRLPRCLRSLLRAVRPVPLPRDASQPHRLLPLRLPGEHG